MRCDDIHARLDALWLAEVPRDVREHLAECALCSAYYRDVAILREGLRLWKQDEAPAPSLGFAQRVVRRLTLENAPPAISEFFERVGRKFVLATLALVAVMVMAFTMPATGPLRALSVTDLQGASQETILASSDPMGTSGALETPEAAVGHPTAPGEAK